MHPLHDHIARLLAEKLKARRVVVWYDPRAEFAPFIGELRGTEHAGGRAVPVSVGGVSALLAEYAGSMFELRAVVEPHVFEDVPKLLVVYVPGRERDGRGSVLMELEMAGAVWEPQLRRHAKDVLLQKYTAGVVDDLLPHDRRLDYHDLAAAASNTSDAESPSILRALFKDTAGTDGLLAAWLASDARDADIAAKDATRELIKLVRSRLGLELSGSAELSKLRSIALRYILAGEFRSDLATNAPTSLESIPAPSTNSQTAAVRELAKRLRTSFADLYPAIADRVEEQLGLARAEIPGAALGSIDTFRFEERALLAHCAELISTQAFDQALGLIGEREHSFWLDRDVGRKAQWEACRRMAELGRIATDVRAEVATMRGEAGAWIDRYAARDGWYRVDQAQRRLEAWVANLDEEPAERALGVVRRAYADACHAMAEGFTKGLVRANWSPATSLHQTQVFRDLVASRPTPTAYFLVDALRFEMGIELAERLAKTAEAVVRPALGVLPSITPIGMAALQPGAAATFDVTEHRGKLGARIDGAFLPDLAARKKFASARVPKLVDIVLDELLSLSTSKLAAKLEGAQLLVVRSQEIDYAGEAGFPFQARQVMDTMIDNLARGLRRLAAAGVEHAVVSADHGHLFFPADREESMRTDAPGGDTIELHRRCWIGRGGATPSGCVRVSAAALGYASDLEFVFPAGCGVFKAAGDLAYHHGGPSLQELVVPAVTVRLSRPDAGGQGHRSLSVTGVPDTITNRIFSVTLQIGGNTLSLFSSGLVVRPLLISAGRQVGAVGMVVDAELDRVTGGVTLHIGKPVTVAFLLNDPVPSLRVVVQDPATDAELYRSPSDIPVRLGV